MSTNYSNGAEQEVTIKRTSQDVPIGIMVEMLGNLGFSPLTEISDSDAIIFTNPDGVTAVIPTDKWRRTVHEGDVHEVHPGNPGRVSISEVSIIAMENVSMADDMRYTTDYIDTYIKNGGPFNGPEYEFSMHLNDGVLQSQDVYPDHAIELGTYQREIPAGPFSGGDFLSHTKLALSEVFLNGSRGLLENLHINFASMHPKNVDLDDWKTLDFGVYGPYVSTIVRTLHKSLIAPFLPIMHENVRSSWDQIAQGLGYENFESIMSHYDDMRFWVMNAGHVSKKAVTTEKGFMSERPARAMDNLLIAYSNILNGLCYSGAMAFGTKVTHEGEPVSDVRELTKRVLITAGDADHIIGPDENLVQRASEQMRAGNANTPDRTAVSIMVNGQDMSGTHAVFRNRSAVTILQYQEYQATGNPEVLGKARRVEYTGRGATPDLEKFTQSVALQEILTIAGAMSVAEGFDDVFEWMKSNGIQAYADMQRINRSVPELSKAMKSLKGEFDKRDIEELTLLTNLVETKLTERAASMGREMPASVKTSLARVRAGLISLVVDRNEYMSMAPVERFNRYLNEQEGGVPLRPMNWGELVNSFSSDDIRGILSSSYNVKTDGKEELGDLVLMLNHHFLLAQLVIPV